MRRIAIVMTVALGLGACAQQGGGAAAPGEFGANKTTAGGLLGAIGGGLAGAQFGKGEGRLVTTAMGTLLGAFVGSQVGTSLDRADQMYAQRAGQTAFESARTGQAVSWTNPDSGHSGTVTPVRTYETNAGQPCREFHQTVNIGGRMEEAYGTACRQPDGTWRIANQ